MENTVIELIARTIDVPPKELVEWLDSRQKVELQEKPPLSPWLSRKAAAEYASVSTDTIDNWCAKGFIEKSKLNDSRPGAVLILRASLEKFLRSRVIRKKRIRSDYAPSIKRGYRVNGKKS